MAKKFRFGHGEIIAIIVTLFFVAACTTVPPTQGPGGPVAEAPDQLPDLPPVDEEPDSGEPAVPDDMDPADEEAGADEYVYSRDGLTPPHMKDREIKRLALLLPFSSKSRRLREESASMLQAAELALFERGEADVLLIAFDTKGTAQGAKAATESAVTSGADVILGPVLASAVKAAGQEARRNKTPIVAFSNDRTVAGAGTYLLSIPPETEVERIVEYVAGTGAQRFAFLGSVNAYGRRVRQAYEQAVRRYGGEITALETYDGRDISVMQAPAQKLADFHKKREAANKDRVRRGLPPLPLAYDAIILPEGGTALRSLAPLLPYYDVDPADVQFLGTGRWKNDETVREPALNGGIFATTDHGARERFLSGYERIYGDDPSSLASLAFDAISVGTVIADGDPKLRRARAEDPAGFYGADGFIRFNTDGTPDRGLAVYQIRGGRFVVIEPAPTKATGPS